MPNPTSWNDVADCPCRTCRAIIRAQERCYLAGAWLVVWDCRMFYQGFRVCDLRNLFVGPATEGPIFPSITAAVAYVKERQPHCAVMLSTYPQRFPGEADFRWSLETA